MSSFALNLSFTSRLADGSIDFWTPTVPDGWAAGCAAGRDYAAELIEFIQQENNPVIFGAVMRAITKKGVYEAVETGFCTHFGIILAGIGTHVEQEDVRDAA